MPFLSYINNDVRFIPHRKAEKMDFFWLKYRLVKTEDELWPIFRVINLIAQILAAVFTPPVMLAIPWLLIISMFIRRYPDLYIAKQYPDADYSPLTWHFWENSVDTNIVTSATAPTFYTLKTFFVLLLYILTAPITLPIYLYGHFSEKYKRAAAKKSGKKNPRLKQIYFNQPAFYENVKYAQKHGVLDADMLATLVHQTQVIHKTSEIQEDNENCQHTGYLITYLKKQGNMLRKNPYKGTRDYAENLRKLIDDFSTLSNIPSYEHIGVAKDSHEDVILRLAHLQKRCNESKNTVLMPDLISVFLESGFRTQYDKRGFCCFVKYGLCELDAYLEQSDDENMPENTGILIAAIKRMAMAFEASQSERCALDNLENYVRNVRLKLQAGATHMDTTRICERLKKTTQLSPEAIDTCFAEPANANHTALALEKSSVNNTNKAANNTHTLRRHSMH